jgi:hypothetical protein
MCGESFSRLIGPDGGQLACAGSGTVGTPYRTGSTANGRTYGSVSRMGTNAVGKNLNACLHHCCRIGRLALVGFLGLKLFAEMPVSDKQALQTAKSESATAIARRPADYSLSMTCQVWKCYDILALSSASSKISSLDNLFDLYKPVLA